MSYLKIILFSVLGFLVPIGIALHFGPRFFESAMPKNPYVRASLGSGVTDDSAIVRSVEETDGTATPEQAPFRTVASDESLDPRPDRYFVVSVDFKITNLPRTGRRQKLIAKYSGKDSPYPGWAVAIRRLNTSTRPEVYWQDQSGNGGWYTFDNVRFEKNEWYAMTLVARDGELLSLYLQQLTSQPAATPADEDEEPSQLGVGAKFIGGYNLAGLSATPTTAALEFSPPLSENNEFRGEVKHILLARPEKIPMRNEKLRGFLEGGAGEIANRVEQTEVGLFIDESGRDQSSAQRAVSTAAVSRS